MIVWTHKIQGRFCGYFFFSLNYRKFRCYNFTNGKNHNDTCVNEQIASETGYLWFLFSLKKKKRKKSRFYLTLLKSFSHNLILKNEIFILLIFHKKMIVQDKLQGSCTETARKGTKTQTPFSPWKKEGKFYSGSIQDVAFQSSIGGEKQLSFGLEIALTITDYFHPELQRPGFHA